MSSRTPLIAGNWKMHKTERQAEDFIQALLPAVSGVSTTGQPTSQAGSGIFPIPPTSSSAPSSWMRRASVCPMRPVAPLRTMRRARARGAGRGRAACRDSR